MGNKDEDEFDDEDDSFLNDSNQAQGDNDTLSAFNPNQNSSKMNTMSKFFSSNIVGPTVIPSKVSEIDRKDPLSLKTSPKMMLRSWRRKSFKGIQSKSGFAFKKKKRRISYSEIKKSSKISDLFKEQKVDPEILERRKNRRRKFKKMKKNKKKRKVKDNNRIIKFKEVMSRERRIPYHPFTCEPKFLQTDKNSPFRKHPRKPNPT